MLYLISGASRSGKSITAKRLMEAKGIPYMPLDCLMMGFMKGMPSIGIHDKMWPNEIAEKIWPFLQAVCENMIYNQIDYIFEGEAMLPELLQPFIKDHPNKVKVVFLGFQNTSLRKKVSEVKQYPNGKNDWLVNQSDAYIEDHISNMIMYSKRIQESCLKYGMPFYDMSQDFETKMAELLGDISSSDNL